MGGKIGRSVDDDKLLQIAASREYSLVKKFKVAIDSAIERIKAIKGGEEKYTMLRHLQKVSKLFGNALESNRGGVAVTTIGDDKDDTAIDSQDNIEYNNSERFSKYRVRNISYKKIGNDNVGYVRSQLVKLYNGFNNVVADGIAIEYGKKVYIVDSGKDNGEIRFGLRTQIAINDDELRKEYVRRKNNESVSKGFISDELSARFRSQYDNDRQGYRGRNVGEEPQIDSNKSENNEERVSSGNGNRGVQRLIDSHTVLNDTVTTDINKRKSVTDSVGNTLTESQQEYFKDSKVRDKSVIK